MTTSALSDHRLCTIRTFTVTSRYPRVVGKNAVRGVHGSGPTSRVRVLTTDRGATAWGLSPPRDLDTSVLVGRPISELFDPQIGVIAPKALPLDLPLHDLAATICGQPVYEMLGSKGDTSIPCYDGAIYMDDILPEENPRGVPAVLDNCHHDYDLGYRAFKLKIGRGHKWMGAEEGLRRDIEITRRVRAHFPDCDILVDANDGYTCDRFLLYLHAVAECNLRWIEEPFTENRTDLARLRNFLARRSPHTLVADGESGYDIDFLLDLAREDLIDVLIMDIVGLGFTAWRRWMPRLVEVGVLASPHTWGDPLKTLYTGHVAAGLGNVVTIEGIPAESHDVDWSQYQLSDGILRVPSAPGFGMELCLDLAR